MAPTWFHLSHSDIKLAQSSPSWEHSLAVPKLINIVVPTTLACLRLENHYYICHKTAQSMLSTLLHLTQDCFHWLATISSYSLHLLLPRTQPMNSDLHASIDLTALPLNLLTKILSYLTLLFQLESRKYSIANCLRKIKGLKLGQSQSKLGNPLKMLLFRRWSCL